jgi:hypothetical protein
MTKPKKFDEVTLQMELQEIKLNHLPPDAAVSYIYVHNKSVISKNLDHITIMTHIKSILWQ